jgi:hypothetical protein
MTRAEVVVMRAAIGDKIVVLGHHVGARDRTRSAIILAVEGEDGGPPYFVRWEDGHESTLAPGPGAFVEHYPVVATGV